jgi:hypothetical protein
MLLTVSATAQDNKPTIQPNESATVPYLEFARREGRLEGGGRAEDLGCFLGLLQTGAGEIARPRHARRLLVGSPGYTAGPADGNNLFEYFLAAYGGLGIVTPDGRPHLDDSSAHPIECRADFSPGTLP